MNPNERMTKLEAEIKERQNELNEIRGLTIELLQLHVKHIEYCKQFEKFRITKNVSYDPCTAKQEREIKRLAGESGSEHHISRRKMRKYVSKTDADILISKMSSGVRMWIGE